MSILRSLLFATVQTLLTVGFSIPAPLLLLLPRHFRWQLMAIWCRSVTYSLRLCKLNYTTNGAENIPQSPCVIIAKHQSAWETIAFNGIFSPVVFVAKRELTWIPCFGWGILVMSPILINRKKPKQAIRTVMNTGTERIKQGFHVCIFPEGSRMALGHTGNFSASAAQLAAKAKVPMLPVAINSGVFWSRNSWKKSPGTISVSIGKPLTVTTDNIRETTTLARDWISQETERLENLVTR